MSHTNFNSGAFTAGAVGGATLAGAMVAGLQGAAGGGGNGRRWDRWNSGRGRVRPRPVRGLCASALRNAPGCGAPGPPAPPLGQALTGQPAR